ncbi:MAG: class I SAM-dependent methyltransferase [Methanobacteriota archaeon]|nr:MAG: class I SAM-dependent methyltransferase [Euryarchaeota archaeon]
MSSSDITTGQWKEVIGVLEDVLPYYEKFNAMNTLGQLGRWRGMAARLATEEDTVLEIGPGSGGFASSLRCGELYCLDPSTRILEYTKKRLDGEHKHFVGGIAENLPFNNDKFDIVYCIFSFRDFMSKETGLRETMRVLKKGGKLCIVDVSIPEDGLLKSLVNVHIYRIAPRLSSLAFPTDRRRMWIEKQYPEFLHTLETFGKASQYPELMVDLGYSEVDMKLLFGRSAFILTGVK